MKHLIKTMGLTYVVIASLWLLGGCASTLQFTADTFGVDVVSKSVKENAYKAASVSFTAWESVQDLTKRTGKLPRCTDAIKFLCVSQATWDKIKEINHKASGVIESTRPVIEAGTDDVALLMSVPAAVYDAQEAINKELAR